MIFKKNSTVKNLIPQKTNLIQSQFQEKPKILLIDLNEEIKETLENRGYNISIGSLGDPIIMPNKGREPGHFCLLKYAIPDNLHEFDLVILDLSRKDSVPYKPEEHVHKTVQGSKTAAYLSSYPETVFNPRPIIASGIDSEIQQILNRNGIIIVFASEYEVIDYKLVTIENFNSSQEDRKYGNYSFTGSIEIKNNKFGKEIIIDKQAGILSDFLRSHIGNSVYEITFTHPSVLNSDGKRVLDEKFFILMRNKDDEIISFCRYLENGAIIVFPQIKNKKIFLVELLDNFLPSLFPALFPYHTEFLWLNNDDYLLPHQAELKQKKLNLIKESEAAISIIDTHISQNKEKFECLHQILTLNSNDLVKKIEKFLYWLEFENIRNMDELKPDQKEEDLQVDIDDNLLVIEIKGLGGTSTDSECSQINKIKFRRSEERGKFDVKALYIVNHQRFLPPLERENPPFKENQIRDALNEKRGLLTTWQLFKLYFLIKENIISKEEARKKFLDFGLIKFQPLNCLSFGIPEHIYQDGTVIIIKIMTSTRVNEKLIVKRGDDYFSSTILEIQVNQEAINLATEGMTVGMKLDRQIKKTDEILKKKFCDSRFS